MEHVETTQTTKRSEETIWTEREKELAERYKIKPERVRRLFVFAENWAEKTLESEAYYEKLEAAANAEPERERESETESAVDDVSVVQAPGEVEVTEGLKITTGIPRLDTMIRRKAWDSQGAMYGCMKLARLDSDLGEKILAMLKSELQPFFETLHPERNQDGNLMDSECEVMPVVEWLAMVDGFQAAGGELSDEREIEEMLDEPKTVTRPNGLELEKKTASETVDDEEEQQAEGPPYIKPDEDNKPEEVEDVPTKRTSLHYEHPEELWKNTYKRIRDIFLQMNPREKLLLWTFWELNHAQGFTSLDIGNDIMRRLDENFDDIGDDPDLNWLKGVYQTTEILSAHS